MQLIKLTTPFLVLILSSGSLMAASESEWEQDMQRFELFNTCEPFDLVIEGVESDARKIGLTKESITMAAESRLRSARLYSSVATGAYLYVNVNVVGNAFSLVLRFNKVVLDSASGVSLFAPTWQKGTTGTHGGTGAAYIMSALSSQMDTFLTQYLRVNEAACESR